jgi:hypothetical protein
LSTIHPNRNVPALDALVQQAGRRTASHAAAAILFAGAAAALAVFILVLIAGTGILHWGWSAAAGLIGAAWAAWRGRKRLPSSYKTAQRIDHALEAKDLLSTAWHFSGSAGKSEFVDTVLRQAGDTASTADAATLMPWKMPRSGYVAAGLLAVCAVLLGVRLGVLKTLDLHAGLAEVSFDTITGAAVDANKKLAKAQQPRPFEGIGVDIPGYEAASLTGDEKNEQFEQFDVEATEGGASGQKGQRSEHGQEGGEGEPGDEPGDQPGVEDVPTGTQDPSRQPGNKGKGSQQDKPNSLMDKMRDALASLMDKLKIEPPPGEGKESASKSQQPGQGKKDGKGQKGQSQNAQADADGEKSDAEGEGEQTQMTKNQSGQPPEPPSGQPKSGMGSQDGSKETAMSEDTEAMGQLSELFGRRSQNVKGEVMVEVNKSRNQALRTPLADRSATHDEAGGEVSRDEVPLHLQDYVQRYYKQVRKTPPPPEAAKQ